MVFKKIRLSHGTYAAPGHGEVRDMRGTVTPVPLPGGEAPAPGAASPLVSGAKENRGGSRGGFPPFGRGRSLRGCGAAAEACPAGRASPRRRRWRWAAGTELAVMASEGNALSSTRRPDHLCRLRYKLTLQFVFQV